MLNYLIVNRPYAKIGIIITNGASVVLSNKDLTPYLNAEIAIAKKWGICYLNEGLGEDLPLFFRSAREDVSDIVKNNLFNTYCIHPTDDWHPCVEWHERESSVVENWLNKL